MDHHGRGQSGPPHDPAEGGPAGDGATGSDAAQCGPVQQIARPQPLAWGAVYWLLLSLRLLIDSWLRAFSRSALL